MTTQREIFSLSVSTVDGRPQWHLSRAGRPINLVEPVTDEQALELAGLFDEYLDTGDTRVVVHTAILDALQETVNFHKKEIDRLGGGRQKTPRGVASLAPVEDAPEPQQEDSGGDAAPFDEAPVSASDIADDESF